MRSSGRTASQIRPVTITRNFTCHAEGSVLIEFGNTKVHHFSKNYDERPRIHSKTLSNRNFSWDVCHNSSKSGG